MTLDERLPLYLLIVVTPFFLLRPFISESILSPRFSDLDTSPSSLLSFESAMALAPLAAVLLSGLILAFWDSYGRKNKGMFDWTLMDSALFAIAYGCGHLFGLGVLFSVLLACMMRNYGREVSLKFGLFVLVLSFLANARLSSQHLEWGTALAGGEMSWFNYGVVLVTSTLCGLLLSSAFMKSLSGPNQRSFKPLALARVLLPILGLIALQIKRSLV